MVKAICIKMFNQKGVIDYISDKNTSEKYTWKQY